MCFGALFVLNLPITINCKHSQIYEREGKFVSTKENIQNTVEPNMVMMAITDRSVNISNLVICFRTYSYVHNNKTNHVGKSIILNGDRSYNNLHL